MTDSDPLRILVVEDEPIVRMMAVDMVEDAGFHAVEAATADEALAILEERSDIRIVFTDIRMPGKRDGAELAFTVSSRWPRIGVIVVSGFAGTSQMALPPGCLFYAKPYRTGEIVESMRAMVSR